MKLSADKLDELAVKAYRTNSLLLHVGDYLRSVKLPDDVASALSTARQNVWSLKSGLVGLGAEDPHARLTREDEIRITGGAYEVPRPRETPLHLLNSDAAVRFARALREAAEACKAMERERGITDGLAEQLSDYADIYHLEVFGPVGLGEGRE